MIPLKLKIRNFLSHAYSEIDFSEFDVALVLGAYDDNTDQSNGAGKSAIFEAISWALFGRSRHKRKDGVVKRDCKSCVVEFIFQIDDQVYKITRKRDKTLGESDVVFEQKVGNQYKSISCDTNTATDHKIVETINVSYDVFLNSVYFKQNDISMFAETTPSKRKDTLKSLLKMEKWDAYQKKASSMRSKLKSQIEEKSQYLVSIDALESELQECSDSISSLKKDIKTLNSEYAQKSEELISKKSAFHSRYDGSGSVEELERLQKELSKAKSRRTQISKQIENNNAEIQSHKSDIAKIEQKIQTLNQHIDAKKKIDINYERNNLLKGQTKEKILREQIKDLGKSIETGDHCATCERPISASEAKLLHKKLADAKASYVKIKNALNTAEDKLKKKEKIVAAGEKAELNKSRAQIKISQHSHGVESCLSKNKQLKSELKSIDVQKLEKGIKELKLKLDKSEAKRLQDEINQLTEELNNNKKKSDKLNIEYGSKVRTKKELLSKIEEQNALKKEMYKINSDFAIYDKLKNYFGKDGIQAIIIENVIEELENYANDILSKICNEATSIEIQTQRQADSGAWSETFDIEITAGGRTDDFETFSGGEQFRVSLALRLALSKILSKRTGGMLRFLLLDEVSSSLDDNGIDMFIDIVKQLGSELKILVITHDEMLKERFDDIIMVNKSQDGSHVAML